MSKDASAPAELPEDGNKASVEKPKRARPPQRKTPPDIPPAEKFLLRAPEVAALTGLHADDVYRMGKSGTFPTLRLGKRVRFPRRAIEAWIEANQRGGA